MATRIINPILPGFYPDPTICQVDEYFYLVTSTFNYFPGLPIFRSKDAVKWEQLGNLIDRSTQINLDNQGGSKGLFSPTLRHYNNKFYCVCNQAGEFGNFLITADAPEGPWSDPVKIKGSTGIDPSLFFDSDGTCWYCGTREVPEGAKYDGNWEIWVQKINLEKAELYGEAKGIWRGIFPNSKWPEGPHIYRFFDKYYLLYAEGGHSLNRAICILRSDKIDGNWEGKPSNPLLTHRHLGAGAKVLNVGHAELFCNKDNRWWMICLASRPSGDKKRYCNMGRETFMVPVRWEDNWPVASWETGLIENAYSFTGHVVKRDNEDADAVKFPVIDDFNSKQLANYWLSIRKRNPEFINCTEQSGSLRLYGGQSLTQTGLVSFVGRRQTGFSYEACTRINFAFVNENDCAGIACFQSEKFNYRLQIIKKGRVYLVQVVRAAGEEDEVLIEDVITGGKQHIEIVLRVVCEKQNLRFEYGPDERNMHLLIDNLDASLLSTEKAGGFVGTVVGMFAVAGGDYTKKEFYADFDWFKYENTARIWTD